MLGRCKVFPSFSPLSQAISLMAMGAFHRTVPLQNLHFFQDFLGRARTRISCQLKIPYQVAIPSKPIFGYQALMFSFCRQQILFLAGVRLFPPVYNCGFLFAKDLFKIILSGSYNNISHCV